MSVSFLLHKIKMILIKSDSYIGIIFNRLLAVLHAGMSVMNVNWIVLFIDVPLSAGIYLSFPWFSLYLQMYSQQHLLFKVVTHLRFHCSHLHLLL
jgi:hypothetical protein